MIFNEIKWHFNTCFGLVGGASPASPPVSAPGVDVFGILQRFLKNLLESKNSVCSATAGTKTALGIIQL